MPNFSGNLQGTASRVLESLTASAAVTASYALESLKLGNSTVGNTAIPIYLENGIPKTASAVSPGETGSWSEAAAWVSSNSGNINTATGSVKQLNSQSASWNSASATASRALASASALYSNIGSEFQPVYLTENGPVSSSLHMVEYIKDTRTSGVAAYTGKSKDSEIYDGKVIVFQMKNTGAANATLNLTLSNGSTTGAKKIFYKDTVRLGTEYGNGDAIFMVYDSAADGGNGGWRCQANYDSNTEYERLVSNSAAAVTVDHLVAYAKSVSDVNATKEVRDSGIAISSSTILATASQAVNATSAVSASRATSAASADNATKLNGQTASYYATSASTALAIATASKALSTASNNNTWIASNSGNIASATASAHTHSNKSVLDAIDAAKTQSWDNKTDNEGTVTSVGIATGSDFITVNNAAAITVSGSRTIDLATKSKNAINWVGNNSASLVASASVAKTANNWITNNSGNIASATSSAHTHSNGDLLDSLTNEQTASWDNAVSGNHTHSNKDFLDTLAAGQFLPITGGTVTGDLTVQQNLIVKGTASYIDTQHLNVKDTLVLLASGSTTKAAANGAGIAIQTASATTQAGAEAAAARIQYDSANNRFTASVAFAAPSFTGSLQGTASKAVSSSYAVSASRADSAATATSATSATKLVGSSGSTSVPVYIDAGVPKAITSLNIANITASTGFKGNLTGTASNATNAATASYVPAAELASKWISDNSENIAVATASAHSHDNKSLLDSITEAKTESWDEAAVSSSEAHNWISENSASALTDTDRYVATASFVSTGSNGANGVKMTLTRRGSDTGTVVATVPVVTTTAAGVMSGAMVGKLNAAAASGTLAKNLTSISASLISSASIAQSASDWITANSGNIGTITASAGTVTSVTVTTASNYVTVDDDSAITTSGIRKLDLAATTKNKIESGNVAYGWGNHATKGYATTSSVNSAISTLITNSGSTWAADTKVTSAANHYKASGQISGSIGSAAKVITGFTLDAAGHVTAATTADSSSLKVTSASYANNSTSASRAISASRADSAVSAASAGTATSASFATNASQLGGKAANQYASASHTHDYSTPAQVTASINALVAASGSAWSSNVDRYVATASFASTGSNGANGVKMTLTRQGSDTGTIVATIPVASTTAAGVMTGAQVTQLNNVTNLTASLIGSTSVAKSASNWITANSGNIASATSSAHTHSNGNLLDSLTEAKTGSWDEAVESIHSHDNKVVLDGITAAMTASWEKAASDYLPLGGGEVTGSLIVQGDLTVNGTTTTVNAQDLNVKDKLILIASGSTTQAAANGAGIAIQTASAATQADAEKSAARFQYRSSDNHFTASVGIEAPSFTGSLQGTASSVPFTVFEQPKGNYLTASIGGTTLMAYIYSASRAAYAGYATTYAGWGRRIATTQSAADQEKPILFASSSAATASLVFIDSSSFTYNPAKNRLSVTNIEATTITGSLKGTASWAENVVGLDIEAASAANTWITNNSGNINLATASAHTHDNKTLLDSLTEAKTGSWDTAATNSHTHSNKAILDTIDQSKVNSWNTASVVAENGGTKVVTATNSGTQAAGTYRVTTVSANTTIILSAATAAVYNTGHTVMWGGIIKFSGSGGSITFTPPSGVTLLWSDASVEIDDTGATYEYCILQYTSGETMYGIITKYSGS